MDELADSLPAVEPKVKNSGTGVCLLIGASGWLGTRLIRDLKFAKVIGMRRPFLDVDMKEKMKAENVSDIVLNAAHVSLGLSYEALRTDNVMLLLRVLRLCLEFGARLHFISSVGAMGESKLEHIVPLSSTILNAKSGYAQTKAVCEGVILRVAERLSCPPRVYRMGTIGPDSVSGAVNPNDMFFHLASTVRLIDCIPENSSLRLNWVPVDVLSAAIASIAVRREDSKPGVCVLHFQSNTPTVAECFASWPVSRVSLQDWRKRVDAALQPSPVKDFLLSIEFQAEGSSTVDMSETLKLLQSESFCFEFDAKMLKQVKKQFYY